MALLIGGVGFGDQDKALEKGVDVLIATPGRLMDQFGRGKILLSGVDILVIDEADRMLDMGFVPDIEAICSKLPPRRQTLLFSARSEEHTSELQSLMRISYAVFCLKKKKQHLTSIDTTSNITV